MVSSAITLGIVAFNGVVATAAYVALLSLRDDAAGTTAYRAFRYGYPVGIVALLLGIVGVLSSAGRFSAIEFLGLSLAPSLVRTVGLVAGMGGLIVAAGLAMLIGFSTGSGGRQESDG